MSTLEWINLAIGTALLLSMAVFVWTVTRR
jgi:hypothetical protein